MATKPRPTWIQKLEKKQEPKIVTLDKKQQEKFGGATMYISTPMEIYELVKTIPKGKVTTVNLIREKLAQQSGADVTCPMTTGIFLWIAANAVEEMRTAGKKGLAPYWRVLKEGGKLNDKYPGGIQQQAAKLEAEGFLAVFNKTGKAASVAGFENKLFRF